MCVLNSGWEKKFLNNFDKLQWPNDTIIIDNYKWNRNIATREDTERTLERITNQITKKENNRWENLIEGLGENSGVSCGGK